MSGELQRSNDEPGHSISSAPGNTAVPPRILWLGRNKFKQLKPVFQVLRQGLIILIITLFLTESVFRCYNYFYPSFVFYDSSYNRWRGQANSPEYDFHLNSKGFNDVEFKLQKDEGTYRILGLGDSFAFGVVPYRYNYLTLLEENLNNSGKKTELVNMGIPGIGPKDYLALLVNEGLELKPDMVLVSFFIGNDFSESLRVRRLYRYSYVASFINYLIVAHQGLNGRIVHGNAVYDDNKPSFNEATFMDIEKNRSEIYRKQSGQFENDFSTALSYLIQMKQICDERHILLAVVLIPDEVQVNHSLQSKVLQVLTANSRPEDFDFALPNHRLMAKLKEHNIESLDLLDDFSARASQTVLYKPNNTHWNIAGNKLAAELIGFGLFHVSPR